MVELRKKVDFSTNIHRFCQQFEKSIIDALQARSVQIAYDEVHAICQQHEGIGPRLIIVQAQMYGFEYEFTQLIQWSLSRAFNDCAEFWPELKSYSAWITVMVIPAAFGCAPRLYTVD